MSIGTLIEQLKAEGQDHEFYPTSAEIIEALIRSVKGVAARSYRRTFTSVLDIGAGNGKVLRALKDRAEFSQLYAIEKSIALCQILDDDVFIIGTDFKEQSLLTKKMDVIFCNPPYSEFKDWSVKIIRESCAPLVYLVIPVRWKDSVEIADAIKFRDATATVVGEFSFISAEDRAARAKVHLIRIEYRGIDAGHRSKDDDDAFDRFFAEEFADLKAKYDAAKPEKDAEDGNKRNPKFNELVSGTNYPDRLVALYNSELAHIRNNYDLVKQLDVELLKEFDVTPARVLACLKARLSGLKNIYWSELFSRMKQVTDRLTSKKRRLMLEKLNANGHVDFTVGNIHAVILWILKNANAYLDAQLIETFDTMVEKANVKNYASNQRAFVHDRWRYNEEKPTHIALEFMLVLQHIGGIKKEWTAGEFTLDETACDFLGDLLTVARNLGFPCKTGDSRLDRWDRKVWRSGEKQIFSMARRDWKLGDKVPWTDTTKRTITERFQLPDGHWQYCLGGDDWVHEGAMPEETLFEVRAYLNRNVHIRLNQRFALAMNVEVGRLRGWLKSGAEAAKELDDPKAAQYFGLNVQLGHHSLPSLGYAVLVPETRPPDPVQEPELAFMEAN